MTAAYGHRPEFVDLATIMVGVNLPIFGGSKQSKQRDEMLAQQTFEAARELDGVAERSTSASPPASASRRSR